MSDGRPVGQLLSPVIVRVLALTVVMALIAIVGVFLSTRSVSYVSEELQPAVSANKDVLSHLSDMRSATREWALGGRQAARDSYDEARAALALDQRTLQRLSAGDRKLTRLVGEQERRAQVWVDEYADPAISGPGGDEIGRSVFLTGVTRFAAFRTAHDRTLAELDRRVAAANDGATLRLRATTLAVLLLALIEGFVILRARRRLSAQVSVPLRELEAVVHRIAANDPAARAEVRGPREVRAVARSLNELADAQGRARAVEAQISRDLRALDVAKDDLVSNVSHELRTPLTTISGYLELVSDEFEGKLKPHHDKMLDAARRNVDRLRLIIDDLLTLSRTEATTTDLTEIDLPPVLRDAVTDMRMTASRRDIRICDSVPRRPGPVLGERVMLHRVFVNLLSNAVKFSADGSEVEVSLAVEDGEARVRIADRGMGIPSNELDQLGTRFFRASNAMASDIGGTGLGIRIVQTIVDKHAGTLAIESEAGVGTTVTVRLPARAVEPVRGPGNAAPASSVP
ncbi:MAG: ATP-binding protein [Nocardioides sp.]